MTPLIREYALNEINMSNFRSYPEKFNQLQIRQQEVVAKLIELNLFDIAVQYAAREKNKARASA